MALEESAVTLYFDKYKHDMIVMLSLQKVVTYL